jgi:hypothetical protein
MNQLEIEKSQTNALLRLNKIQSNKDDKCIRLVKVLKDITINVPTTQYNFGEGMPTHCKEFEEFIKMNNEKNKYVFLHANKYSDGYRSIQYVIPKISENKITYILS